MDIHIVNGPNLNLLGIREPEKYGTTGFPEFLETLRAKFPQATISYFQSNVEGELINYLHQHGFSADGILLNAGGYTHTSVALRDAVAAIRTPVLEIHLTNIYAREEYRRQNLLAEVCIGSVTGLGLHGYELGMAYFCQV